MVTVALRRPAEKGLLPSGYPSDSLPNRPDHGGERGIVMPAAGATHEI